MDEDDKAEGQITFSAYRLTEGGHVSNLQKKNIRLELITPDDEAILAERGLTALRQARILRLLSRAAEQGAVLTYDNLVHLLCTSSSTVQRDLRALRRMGCSVPVHCRRGRRAGVLLFPFLIAILWSAHGQAQLSSVYGTIGLDYQYDNDRSESASTSRQLFLHQYNLGIDGRILDPRLAAFSLSGAFSTSFLGENSRATSFSGIVALLQEAPYGLTLRAGRSFSSGGIDAGRSFLSGRSDTESNSLGANLRITRPDWPQFYIDFDRVALESSGESRAENSITTGKLRVSHQLWGTMFDGEVGVQNFTDKLNDTSQDRYFGRLNGTLAWSPTTTLRSVSDVFLQGNQLGMSSSYSLENRPDPTLSRTLGVSYRSNRAGDETDYSLNMTGAISKTFAPYSWLQANFFTSAIAQKRFGNEDPAGVAWSAGNSSTISYFRPVSLLADYAVAVSYETDIGQPATTHQAHFGFISQTLEPLRLSGDYFLGLQTGLTQSTRHFLAGKAEAVLTPQLYVRSFADYLIENIRSQDLSSDRQAATVRSQGLSSDRKAATVGAGVSYRPLFNLSLDLAGDVQWTDDGNTSGITMRGNLRVSYMLPAPGSPTLDINGIWERATATDDQRLEIDSRLNYRFGQTTLMLEHRLQRRQTAGSSGLSNSIHFNVSRPFRIGF